MCSFYCLNLSHVAPPFFFQLDAGWLARPPLKVTTQDFRDEIRFLRERFQRDDTSVRKKGGKKLKTEDEKRERTAAATAAGLRDLTGSL